MDGAHNMIGVPNTAEFTKLLARIVALQVASVDLQDRYISPVVVTDRAEDYERWLTR